MPKVTFVSSTGERSDVEVPAGENVMRGAIYNGVEEILGECGGALSCATCHCYVDAEWAEAVGGPSSEVEAELLENAAAEIKPTSRLSCQIIMTDALDGMVIHTPADQY